MSQRRTFVNVPAAVLLATQRSRAAPSGQASVAATAGTEAVPPKVDAVQSARIGTAAVIVPRDGAP